MDLFKNLDIVKILGIGLSGFGFLLRFLAYRLINRIVGTKPDKKVFIIISLYMFVCFIMTVTVGIFTYFTTTYKNTQLTEQSKKLKDNSVALNVLAASHKYDIIGDSIEKIASEYKTIEKYMEQHNQNTGSGLQINAQTQNISKIIGTQIINFSGNASTTIEGARKINIAAKNIIDKIKTGSGTGLFDIIPFRNDISENSRKEIFIIPINRLKFRKENGRINADVQSYEKANSRRSRNRRRYFGSWAFQCPNQYLRFSCRPGYHNGRSQPVERDS